MLRDNDLISTKAKPSTLLGWLRELSARETKVCIGPRTSWQVSPAQWADVGHFTSRFIAECDGDEKVYQRNR